MSDRGRVQDVKREDRERRKAELRDLREVLESKAGRRVFWRYLSVWRMFGSVYDRHGGDMAYKAAQQDCARMMWADAEEAGLDLVAAMKREADEAARLAASTKGQVPEESNDDDG